MTDTKNVMKETDSLEELEGLDGVLPFEVSERDGNVYITPAASNLLACQKFKELSQKEQKLVSILQFIGSSMLLPIFFRENRPQEELRRSSRV